MDDDGPYDRRRARQSQGQLLLKRKLAPGRTEFFVKEISHFAQNNLPKTLTKGLFYKSLVGLLNMLKYILKSVKCFIYDLRSISHGCIES